MFILLSGIIILYFSLKNLTNNFYNCNSCKFLKEKFKNLLNYVYLSFGMTVPFETYLNKDGIIYFKDVLVG